MSSENMLAKNDNCVMNTLIVDDNTAIRKSIKAVLSCHFPHMRIKEASSGEEALEKIRFFVPDLIFIDIKLPGRNGLEIIRAIRSAHEQHITVVILSSYDIREYREAAFQYGAHYFLSKNVSSSQELVTIVDAIHAQKMA